VTDFVDEARKLLAIYDPNSLTVKVSKEGYADLYARRAGPQRVMVDVCYAPSARRAEDIRTAFELLQKSVQEIEVLRGRILAAIPEVEYCESPGCVGCMGDERGHKWNCSRQAALEHLKT
jgi:hypothetical protein